MTRIKRSRKDESLNLLFELAGLFWQIGAVVTAGFIFFALFTFRWARHISTVAETSPLLAPLAATYGWLLFGVPIVFLSLAVLFGKKTIEVWLENIRR